MDPNSSGDEGSADPSRLPGLKSLSIDELLRYTTSVPPPAGAIPIPQSAPQPLAATEIFFEKYAGEPEEYEDFVTRNLAENSVPLLGELQGIPSEEFQISSVPPPVGSVPILRYPPIPLVIDFMEDTEESKIPTTVVQDDILIHPTEQEDNSGSNLPLRGQLKPEEDFQSLLPFGSGLQGTLRSSTIQSISPSRGAGSSTLSHVQDLNDILQRRQRLNDLQWQCTLSDSKVDRTWLAIAYLQGVEAGRGSAGNKREAKHIAARMALVTMEMQEAAQVEIATEPLTASEAPES